MVPSPNVETLNALQLGTLDPQGFLLAPRSFTVGPEKTTSQQCFWLPPFVGPGKQKVRSLCLCGLLGPYTWPPGIVPGSLHRKQQIDGRVPEPIPSALERPPVIKRVSYGPPRVPLTETYKGNMGP